MMRSVFVVLALAVSASATSLRRKQPELTLPEKDGDKAFKSSADACQACNFFAHTAAFGATSGGFKMETTDQDNWRWTCSPTPTIGDNYKLCFEASGRLNEDQYGDATA